VCNRSVKPSRWQVGIRTLSSGPEAEQSEARAHDLADFANGTLLKSPRVGYLGSATIGRLWVGCRGSATKVGYRGSATKSRLPRVGYQESATKGRLPRVGQGRLCRWLGAFYTRLPSCGPSFASVYVGMKTCFIQVVSCPFWRNRLTCRQNSRLGQRPKNMENRATAVFCEMIGCNVKFFVMFSSFQSGRREATDKPYNKAQCAPMQGCL
jgi:hypothetical protein